MGYSADMNHPDPRQKNCKNMKTGRRAPHVHSGRMERT